MLPFNIRNKILDITDLRVSEFAFSCCFPIFFFLMISLVFLLAIFGDSVKFLISKGIPVSLWIGFCFVISIISPVWPTFIFPPSFIYFYFFRPGLPETDVITHAHFLEELDFPERMIEKVFPPVFHEEICSWGGLVLS